MVLEGRGAAEDFGSFSDYTNCDPEKGQQTWYSSFREFLLWPDLEVSAPQGGGGELSDYEKLRVARMEANTEFLRGLGLA